MSVVLYVIKIMLIYITFSFDFLGLDNVDFSNYFANEVIRWLVFKPFKTLAVHALSDIRHSAVASCLHVYLIEHSCSCFKKYWGPVIQKLVSYCDLRLTYMYKTSKQIS